MDNTFIQEKLLAWLTFNPGLALTGFRTTRPWTINCDILILKLVCHFLAVLPTWPNSLRNHTPKPVE